MSNNKSKILTELPKWESGAYKGKVNCQAMVGMKLEIEYKQNVYTVEIIDYISAKKPRFLIDYKGSRKEIQCNHFMTGNFGGFREWSRVCFSGTSCSSPPKRIWMGL